MGLSKRAFSRTWRLLRGVGRGQTLSHSLSPTPPHPRFGEVSGPGSSGGPAPGEAGVLPPTTRPLWSEMPATTQPSFRDSFSAGSTPIFASKYAFFSIFRDLQEYHLLASKFCKIFCKNLQFFAEICKICLREDDFLVDFEKC